MTDEPKQSFAQWLKENWGLIPAAIMCAALAVGLIQSALQPHDHHGWHVWPDHNHGLIFESRTNPRTGESMCGAVEGFRFSDEHGDDTYWQAWVAVAGSHGQTKWLGQSCKQYADGSVEYTFPMHWTTRREAEHAVETSLECKP